MSCSLAPHPMRITRIVPWIVSTCIRFWAACLVLGSATYLGAASPSFEREVMAVLSRTGCNLGTCHGNLNGKGALFLSLRGQDPWLDYQALVHDQGGRRVNRIRPSDSLMLLKPTAQVPHQGGQRMTVDSPEYRILQEWIAAGMPGPDPQSPRLARVEVTPTRLIVPPDQSRVPLRVLATFSNESPIDVTDLATFETTNYAARVQRDGIVERLTDGETTILVRYLDKQVAVQLAFLPADTSKSAGDKGQSDTSGASPIDGFIRAKLRELGVTPRPLAPDHVFLRRVYLDLTGRLPTAEEAQGFARDARPNKRQQLIDSLLARPEFADQWALRWGDLLRNEEKLLDAQGVERFHRWIRQSFADGLPLDEFARQILAAQGSTYEHPPTNFYRAIRDPLARGEAAARVWLGVRLECAKCHNHPFDRWTQDDYYDWATVFGRIDYEIVENQRKDKFDQHEFVGEQRIIWKPEGEVTNARTGRPAAPRFLGNSETVQEGDSRSTRLEQLAQWLTIDDPRPFARAQANRIWYHCLGRGLVEPLDDFRVTNPASHPDLLDYLADQLIASRFDVRSLVRQILRSETYQADWIVDDGSPCDVVFGRDNFAGVRPRRLTAEQLLDAQCQVLDVPPGFNGYAVGTRANQLAGVQRVRPRDERPSQDDRFLSVFGKPERLLSCECERSDATTLSQAFYLLNGPALQRRLTASNSRLSRWLDESRSSEQIVDRLFWTALARAPSTTEREECVRILDAGATRQDALQDLTWAILSTEEFLFRP